MLLIFSIDVLLGGAFLMHDVVSKILAWSRIPAVRTAIVILAIALTGILCYHFGTALGKAINNLAH